MVLNAALMLGVRETVPLFGEESGCDALDVLDGSGSQLLSQPLVV